MNVGGRGWTVAIAATMVAAGLGASSAQAKPGDVFLADDEADRIVRISPDNGLSTVSSGDEVEFPVGVAVDRDGSLLVADEEATPSSGAVIRIDPATGAQTIVSSNAISAAAGGAEAFLDPLGIDVAPNGAIIVGDRNAVIRVDPATGRQTVLASGVANVYDIAVAPNGTIYATGDAAVGRVESGDFAPIASGPPLGSPGGLELEPGGRLLFADQDNSIVGRIKIGSGNVTTLSSGGELDEPFGIGRLLDGRAFVSDYGTQTAYRVDVRSGDQEAVGPVLTFTNPLGVAVEPPRCAGRLGTFYGTPGKDVIKGGPSRDVIAGLGGKDVIKGKGGKDRICGGGGKDKLNGGGGKDKLKGGGGADRLNGAGGKDRCRGGGGRDKLKGC